MLKKLKTDTETETLKLLNDMAETMEVSENEILMIAVRFYHHMLNMPKDELLLITQIFDRTAPKSPENE